jgi:plastocyanin
MKVRPAFLLALLTSAAACGGGGSSYSSTTGPTTGGNQNPTPPANTVIASATLVFNPTSLSVATGTTVTFTFETVTHNITFTAANGVPADVPNTADASVTRVFSTPGTFSYHCTIHPSMTGTVTVQ